MIKGRYCVSPGWGSALPFPEFQYEHDTYEEAVAEAKRICAILPQFEKDNAELIERLIKMQPHLSLPAEEDRAIAVHPHGFDMGRGMQFDGPTSIQIICHPDSLKESSHA